MLSKVREHVDLYVIGIGPGNAAMCTPQADEAIQHSTVIVGYNTYIDLIRDRIGEKRIIATGMMRERERCNAAVQSAAKGERVAVICSGDAGVYGMASLVLECAQDYDLHIEIVPGITAACSGAAVLGAPISHDFCVISLSDLLTPQELIDKRINAAAEADFCIVLYNPMSKTRRYKLMDACDRIMQYRPENTVCGWVRNIGRYEQESTILTLQELRDAKLDMFCTLFIGNHATKVVNGRMVTPRGYDRKVIRRQG